MKIPEEDWTELDLPDPPHPDNYQSDSTYKTELCYWLLEVEYMNWKYTKKFQKLLFGIAGLGILSVLVTVIYVVLRILG